MTIDAARVERAARIACDELRRRTKGSTAAWFEASEIQRDHMRAVASALLRDLDAQDAAPAGSEPPRAIDIELKQAIQVVETHLKGRERDFLNGVLHQVAAFLAPTPPFPALHAPTVEACIAELHACANSSPEVEFAVRVSERLRALTSGAEAGERGEARDLLNERRERREELLAKSAEVEARGPAGARGEEHTCASGNSDREASAEPRPLSEWSDDNLFRASEKWTEETRWNSICCGELRKRGWRPHHGSDKAPVGGEVEVRLRNGEINKPRDASGYVWRHYDNAGDIIAYRPVPAKANQEGGDAPRTPAQETPCVGHPTCNEAPGSTPGAGMVNVPWEGYPYYTQGEIQGAVSKAFAAHDALVAQRTEQGTSNPEAAGSSPAESASTTAAHAAAKMEGISDVASI